MISLPLAATILSLAGLPHATVSKCWPRSHDAQSCSWAAPAEDLGIEGGWEFQSAIPVTLIHRGHKYLVHTPYLQPEWTTVQR